jgi:hypothetical protein
MDLNQEIPLDQELHYERGREVHVDSGSFQVGRCVTSRHRG